MIRLIVLLLLFTCTTSFAIAQLGGGGGGQNGVPVFMPDCGSVESTPLTENPGNMNCWISRNATRAIAVHVYNDNGLKATFRQYSFDGESFASTTTRITNNGTVLTPIPDPAVIAVTLAPVANAQHPNMYKMVYTKDGTEYIVGHMNFVKGNKGRPASKLSVKLSNKTMGVKVTPNTGDPCDEMPIEDIGEEELIGRSPTIANAPINFIAPIGPCQN